MIGLWLVSKFGKCDKMIQPAMGHLLTLDTPNNSPNPILVNITMTAFSEGMMMLIF
jgi:hypothetical protein